MFLCVCVCVCVGASQVVLVVKNLSANAGDIRDAGSIPVSKIPWRRAWQPTPVFLPKESHGQRSLVGYSPWGHKKLDTVEQLSTAWSIWGTLGWMSISLQNSGLPPPAGPMSESQSIRAPSSLVIG